MEQGTHEWHMARLGFVTASRFKDLKKEPRNKAARESGELSASAETYLDELIGEHLTRRYPEEYETKEMKWGKLWEAEARRSYTLHKLATGLQTAQTGFEMHPAQLLVGGSPDGFIGPDGLLEIKCPMTQKNHARVLRSGVVPKEHVDQVQGNLWVTGRKWAHFESYHPHFKHPNDCVVIPVERDDELIAEIEGPVIAFRDRLLKELERFGIHIEKLQYQDS